MQPSVRLKNKIKFSQNKEKSKFKWDKYLLSLIDGLNSSQLTSKRIISPHESQILFQNMSKSYFSHQQRETSRMAVRRNS